MTYYALKNEDGRFWGGGVKLCHPPLLVFNADISSAHVSRSSAVMANAFERSRNKHSAVIAILDSKDHARLAD